MKRREVLGLGLTAGLLASCQSLRLPGPGGSTTQNHDLEIWWSEGYYPEEADAIESILRAWENKSGKKANLKFFSEMEIAAKFQMVMNGGRAPDVLYGYASSETIIPALSHKGLIAPLDDIVAPIQADLLPGIAEEISTQSRRGQKRAIYGAPLSQHSTNIHYWRDLLEEATGVAGVSMVPRNWKGFWKFWSDCQYKLREKGYSDVFAMALPMSSQGRDTSYIFEFFLEAHGAHLINQSGQLLIDKPQVRRGVMDALSDYSSLYINKTVPPQATRWGDADNNISFLSSMALMTVNPTLSIPGSQLSDEIAYYERLGSLGWPNRLDGRPMRSVVAVNQAVVFNGSNVETAKSFLSFLLKPENLSVYVQGAQGRYLPVNKKIIDLPYWRNPKDQHLKTAIANIKFKRESPITLNAAYSQVLTKNIWAHAIESLALGTTSLEKATDQALLEIKDVFRSWG